MKVHVILYDGELRVHPKHKPRKVFRVILKTTVSIDVNPVSQEEFIILTPSFSFRFRCRHEVASMDWVNCLRSQALVKEKSFIQSLFSISHKPPSVPPIAPNTRDTTDLFEKKLTISPVPQHHCYIYTGKKILKNIWVGIICEDSAKVKKKTKIKVPTFIIGRSTSSDMRLKDPFISRSHCKIVLVETVPYICDMGQSGRGKISP